MRYDTLLALTTACTLGTGAVADYTYDIALDHGGISVTGWVTVAELGLLEEGDFVDWSLTFVSDGEPTETITPPTSEILIIGDGLAEATESEFLVHVPGGSDDPGIFAIQDTLAFPYIVEIQYQGGDGSGAELIISHINGFPGNQSIMFFGDPTTHVLGTREAIPCDVDLSGDGVVDTADLLALLAEWGPVGPMTLTFAGTVDQATGYEVGGVAAEVGSPFTFEVQLGADAGGGSYLIEGASFTLTTGTYTTVTDWTTLGNIDVVENAGSVILDTGFLAGDEHLFIGLQASDPAADPLDPMTWGSDFDGDFLVRGSGGFDSTDRISATGPYTGTLTMTITPASSPADLNGDGVVDTADMLLLLGGWGSCP